MKQAEAETSNPNPDTDAGAVARSGAPHFEAVVFLDDGDRGRGFSSTIPVSAGKFNDAEMAWRAAREKCSELNGVAHTVKALATRTGDGNFELGFTIRDARSLVGALSAWAAQTLDPVQRAVVVSASEAIEKTLVSGWTEVDEALQRIGSATRRLCELPDASGGIAKAIDGLQVGAGFLHRWQDRGGAVGNAGPL